MGFRCETCTTTNGRHFSSEKASRCRDCERDAQLRSKYGIDQAQFLAMRHAQGEGCAICSVYDHLVVDHDHRTGRVRGLLCHACNKAIGLLQDNWRVCDNAATYLRDTNDHRTD